MHGIFPMTHKRSSAIVGLGHDRQTSTLAVRWRSGRVSFHYGVPREMFAQFLGADSLGQFFRKFVRGKFRKDVTQGLELFPRRRSVKPKTPEFQTRKVNQP
jgi:hypothetical protein